MLTREGIPYVGWTGERLVSFLPEKMNRHGLIAGATGTGKTVTCQTLAETFSDLGSSVFLVDAKGDLTGMGQPGGNKSSVTKRVDQYGLRGEGYEEKGYPVRLWDPFGEQGTPMRMTISGIGPMLLERILELNDVQCGLLEIAFRVADDNGLLLYDLKDLQAMLRYLAEHRKEISATYGNVSTASVGAIQRSLLRLERQGGDRIFGMPDFDPKDLLTAEGGQGTINILEAKELMKSPRLYSSLLVWLLSSFYDDLPEVGDPDHPALVFFFDEAHLLFDDINKPLLEKLTQVIKLIRSKGVGIYFISQSPSDIPDEVLGQLGNKVLHALRAYTPSDMKRVKAAADSFRPNPDFDMAETIQALGTGEAIVSFLDDHGAPEISERVSVLPPQSFIGPVSDGEREEMIRRSPLERIYRESVDPRSAYEDLEERAEQDKLEEEQRAEAERRAKATKASAKPQDDLADLLGGMLKSASRAMGSSAGREITRSIFGTLLGGKRRR
ncbi:helicase HerA-like domain-containing protein [uncultured Porphyromonas sp.]|uniref:helicase HerA-like domain-containing protein n=1 Tax=uncultured Porphyromonas sp. TaxID=159274 RepID=UPI00260CBF04|nr:helicase HerA-like domain-containing protein [uncultured Porphyromonas sp.]